MTKYTDMTNIQVFNYNGSNVPMTRNENGVVYVNLTEIAKAFPNKNLSKIVNSIEIKEYCKALAEITNVSSADLLIVSKGGDVSKQGTWAHQKVALRVAQKLSPDFAVQVDTWIEELLTKGKVELRPAVPQSYSEALRQLADEVEAKEKAQLLLAEKSEQLDESKEWYSIKRWAKKHRRNWRDYSWRKLKAVSYELGYEVKKIFDSNFDEVNIYHRVVFEAVYGR